MQIGKKMLATVCVVLLTAEATAMAGDAPDQDAPVAWSTPGTEWLVRVRQYSRSWGLGYSDPRMAEEAQRPRVDFEFHMRITVLDPRREGEEQIARIRFAPMDDAPEHLRGKIRVLELVAATGRAIGTTDDEKPIVLRGAKAPLGEEHGLFTEAYGFPTDWTINATDLSLPPTSEVDRSVIDKAAGSFVKKLRRTAIGGERQQAVEVEAATSWLDAEPRRKVVQVWVPGEGWWRSFSRYIQGHIDLEATLVDREGELESAQPTAPSDAAP